MWVCLKMLCTPTNPMVLLIIIPMKNGYFIGGLDPISRHTHVCHVGYDGCQNHRNSPPSTERNFRSTRTRRFVVKGSSLMGPKKGPSQVIPHEKIPIR